MAEYVTMYRTADGKLFDERDKAENWEAICQTVKLLSLDTLDIYTITSAIATNPATVSTFVVRKSLEALFTYLPSIWHDDLRRLLSRLEVPEPLQSPEPEVKEFPAEDPAAEDPPAAEPLAVYPSDQFNVEPKY